MVKIKIGSETQFNYWNNAVNYWLKYDNEINIKFNNITQVLFSSINLSKAKNILDVGCGSGFTTKIISDVKKTSGNILGMDLSEPMLKLFKKKYKNINNISTIQADAQKYNFKKSSFDLIFSRFGLMFFDNPYLAFKNLYNALKKSGSITFVCWTDYGYNQFFSIPVKILTDVTGLKKNRVSKSPGPFAFNNKKYVYDILKKNNFKNIKIKTIKTKLVAENIKTDLDIFMKIGIAAKMMRENNLDKREVLKVRNKLDNYLVKHIYDNSGFYKGKIFLINAIK